MNKDRLREREFCMSHRGLAYLAERIFRRVCFFLGKRNLVCALWWGIEIGERPLFDGKCCFKRHPNSSIKIGNYCKFRSRSTSNLIGINRPCIISTHAETATIVIGDFCGFSGTVVGAFKKIRIGNHVRCGANTLITDSDWHPEDSRSGKPADVVIEDNVWLGVNSVVLKGVTIGTNTVIGANSVVTKNIPANVIAVGNPCKVVRVISGK